MNLIEDFAVVKTMSVGDTVTVAEGWAIDSWAIDSWAIDWGADIWLAHDWGGKDWGGISGVRDDWCASIGLHDWCSEHWSRVALDGIARAVDRGSVWDSRCDWQESSEDNLKSLRKTKFEDISDGEQKVKRLDRITYESVHFRYWFGLVGLVCLKVFESVWWLDAVVVTSFIVDPCLLDRENEIFKIECHERNEKHRGRR